MLKPKFFVGFVAFVALALVGCTGSYWQHFFDTASVEASVEVPGKLTWTGEKDAGGQITYTSSKTEPVVRIRLKSGSSAVDVESISVSYFSPRGDGDTRAAMLVSKVPASFYPFQASVPAEGDSRLNLGAIINMDLQKATDPNAGTPEEWDVAALVTFRGKTKLSQSISWKVSVPVTIEVEAP